MGCELMTCPCTWCSTIAPSPRPSQASGVRQRVRLVLVEATGRSSQYRLANTHMSTDDA